MLKLLMENTLNKSFFHLDKNKMPILYLKKDVFIFIQYTAFTAIQSFKKYSIIIQAQRSPALQAAKRFCSKKTGRQEVRPMSPTSVDGHVGLTVRGFLQTLNTD